jgi:two-component system response regulator HydG
MIEAAAGDCAVVFVNLPGGDVRVVATAGADADAARAMARTASNGHSYGRGTMIVEPLGRDPEGPRFGLVAAPRPLGHPVLRRLRMIATVARQGFALCAARERPTGSAVAALDRSLEPLLPGFLTASAAMTRLVEQIQRLQGNDLTVLITGESGTGKELVAKAIHAQSTRKNGPFLAINCAAMPPALLESELFGHVRGAFTDAKTARTGLFAEATGGTIFLDEIGELPLEMQPKLLRALQERKVRPVGGNHEVPFDARIVAATNRDLETEVFEKRFREDLYYRVNVVALEVPPLRERGGDILLMAQSFAQRAAARANKEVKGIATATAEKLAAYDWPGNVRELENCLERAVALMRFDSVMVDDLPEKIRNYQADRFVLSADDPAELVTAAELERRYMQRVLALVGGNKSRAAKILGFNRRTLYRKMGRTNSKTTGDESR